MPRQCAHWLAMTRFSMISAAVLLQSTTKSVIANQPAGWCGNPHPRIRRMLSPHRGDKFITSNYNLSYETLTVLRMDEIAPFSNRDTWAWEIPRVEATSIWVLPSKNRIRRILFSRSPRA